MAPKAKEPVMGLKKFYDDIIKGSDAEKKIFGEDFVYSQKGIEKLGVARKKYYKAFEVDDIELDSLSIAIEAITRQSAYSKVMRKYELADPEKFASGDRQYLNKAYREANKAKKAPLDFDPRELAKLAQHSFDSRNFENGWDYANFADKSYEVLAKEADKRGILIEEFSKQDVMEIFGVLGWEDAFSHFLKIDSIRPSELKKATGASLGDSQSVNFSNPEYVMRASLLFQSAKAELTRLSKLVNSNKRDKKNGLTLEETQLKLVASVEAYSQIFNVLGKGLSDQGVSLEAIKNPTRVQQRLNDLIGNRKKETDIPEEKIDPQKEAQDVIGLRDYSQSVDDLMDKYGNSDNIKEFASKYLELDDMRKGISLKRLWMDSSKGGIINWDKWRQLHSYSYIYNPLTWMKAIANNSIKQGLWYVDQGTAIALEKAFPSTDLGKSITKGDPDLKTKIVSNEIDGVPQDAPELIDLYLGWQGWKNANKMFRMNMADMFKKETPVDPDVRWYTSRNNVFKDWREALDEKDGWTDIEKELMLAGGMPGRVLGAVDEGFKTLSVAREMNIFATKKAYEVYKKTGDVKQAENEWLKIMSEPSELLDGVLEMYARPDTFTNRVKGGGADKLLKLMNNPLLKLEFVFPRILLAQLGQGKDYIPGVGYGINKLISPRNKEILSKGGREAKVLQGKQLQGTLILSLIAGKALDLKNIDEQTWAFTGKRPGNKQEADIWRSLGIDPWSIVYKQDDGSWKSVSYELIAPLNMIFGLGATTGYAFKNHNVSDINAEGLLMGTAELLASTLETNTIFTYTTYLEDVLDLIDTTDNTNIVESLSNFAGEYMGDFTIRPLTSVLGPTNISLQDFVEDIYDPTEKPGRAYHVKDLGAFSGFANGISDYIAKIQDDTFLPDLYPGQEGVYKFDYSGSGHPQLRNFFPTQFVAEGLLDIYKTPEGEEKNNQAREYLATNLVSVTPPNLKKIRQGPDYGNQFVELNNMQSFNLSDRFYNSKLVYEDVDGNPMFPDAGPMTLWETVSELTIGLGDKTKLFQQLPSGGDFDSSPNIIENTKSKEINRIVKFFYDNALMDLEKDPDYSNRKFELKQQTMLESYQ